MSLVTMYIIQRTEGGIPEEPRLFSERETAEEQWGEYWSEFKQQLYDIDGDPISDRERLGELDYFSTDADGDVEYRWYEPIVEDA